MRKTALLVVLFPSSAQAAMPPAGRAWECPITQRFRCGPASCVRERVWGRHATLDPRQGWIIPCRVVPVIYECTPHAALFYTGPEEGSLVGVGSHGVPVFASVTADNRFTIAYTDRHVIHISRGQCHDAEAPNVLSPPVPAPAPR